jgi:hypothetical protein
MGFVRMGNTVTFGLPVSQGLMVRFASDAMYLGGLGVS